MVTTQKKLSLSPSLTICFDLEQFVLVTVSVCSNKSLSTQSFTKQELPKDQVEQNPTYEIDSLW